jgi:hypothetical protein
MDTQAGIQSTLNRWSEQQAVEQRRRATASEQVATRKRVAKALCELDAAVLEGDAPAAADEWAPFWRAAVAAVQEAGRTLATEELSASAAIHGAAAEVWNLALTGASEAELARVLSLALSTMRADFRHEVCGLTAELGERLKVGHARAVHAAAAKRRASAQPHFQQDLGVPAQARVGSAGSGSGSGNSSDGDASCTGAVAAGTASLNAAMKIRRADRRLQLAKDGNVEELADELTDRQASILKALMEVGAASSSSRCSAAKLSQRKLGDCDSKLLVHPLQELVAMGLIKSAGGRAGGYWITAVGQKVVEHRAGKSGRASVERSC